MDPIQNTWIEVKKAWSDLSPRNRDAVWTLTSHLWDQVASSERFVHRFQRRELCAVEYLVKGTGF
jgi:lipopolysaccharide biosynthesis glycosyltransferase